MKESQIKPLNKQNQNNHKQSSNSEQQKSTKEINKYEVIKSLPTWSIEPPLEIKRGN